MDLKAILAANKAKTERANLPRKPVEIANQDRPYSISETTDQLPPYSAVEPISSSSNVDPQNFVASVTLGKERTLLTPLEQSNKGLISPFLNFDQPLNQIESVSSITDSNATKLYDTKTDKKPNTNPTQIKHKVHTNSTQNLYTNSTQSEHSEVIKNRNYTQTQHKVDTQPNTQKTQSKHKLNTKQTQTEHVSALIGIQRNILLFIFEECKKARSHITEPLSIAHISNSLEIASGSIKTSIARLCEKRFMIINCFKNGRGGWSTYEIPDGIYKELLQMETQHKLHTNYTQSKHKLDTQPNTQPNTSISSSSSYLNIKETTTTELGKEWNFDLAPYNRFGFTSSQLKQLASLGVISANDVEQSLIEFSYDLDNNTLPPIKTNKINFLMGLLRAGHSYVSDGFKNEQDVMIVEMARRASEKRENLIKAKFEAWEAALSDEDRKKLEKKLPTHLMVLHHAHGMSNAEVRNWLFNYYLQITKG